MIFGTHDPGFAGLGFADQVNPRRRRLVEAACDALSPAQVLSR